MMTRREFSGVVGGALVAAAAPLRAQTPFAGPTLDIAEWS
jgi:hypothetical protein